MASTRVRSVCSETAFVASPTSALKSVSLEIWGSRSYPSEQGGERVRKGYLWGGGALWGLVAPLGYPFCLLVIMQTKLTGILEVRRTP